MTESFQLVDTSILIDYFRGYQAAQTWIDATPQELAVSVVTAVELITGCRNRQEQAQMEANLVSFPMVLISAPMSQTAWEWYCRFHLSHGVDFLDCLIGASAYHLGVTVYTLNEKHFRLFPEVKVERPY
jgi:predicted nucleic acid-binding protein